LRVGKDLPDKMGILYNKDLYTGLSDQLKQYSIKDNYKLLSTIKLKESSYIKNIIPITKNYIVINN
jgi:hypothetical protein